MSVRLHLLCKLSFIIAISDMADSRDNPEAEAVLKRIHDRAAEAVEKWPVFVEDREVPKLQKRIVKFCDQVGWDNSCRHIQVPINFALFLIETIYENLSDIRKKNLIKNVIDALNSAYRYFSSGSDGEYPEAIDEGIMAAGLWDEVMNG